ncbi:MAG: hypothetical protein GY929_18940 [Actinomycetia bacterium]|nr:hypothetical protein [Actinomycetes bacterium]
MRYLSDEWFRAADQLVRSDAMLAGLGLAAPVALGYRITGGPDGDCRWRIVLDNDRSRVETRSGDHERADVEFTQSWGIAVAIAQGHQNAAAAFLAGAVTVAGDRQLLVRHAAPLGLIGEILHPLTERTDW